MNCSDFITGPPATSTVAEHTLYARDANGEVMAIYKGSNTEANRYNMTCSEWYIYGSKSHGRFARSQEPPYNTTMPVYDPALLYNAGTPPIHTRRLKYKDYEIKDHLGNVTTLFSDLKLPAGTYGTYFKIDLMEANNFYPFGMSESGLHYTAPSFNYRYSYNGKEKDDAIKGEGNSYDYGARFFDPRLGRFLSLDPLRKDYPSVSPFAYCGNNPIFLQDEGGRIWKDANGNIIISSTGETTGYGVNATTELMANSDGTYSAELIYRNYERVNIYADNGTEIPALKLVDSYIVDGIIDNTQTKILQTFNKRDVDPKKNDPVADCHGNTFTQNRLWIDNIPADLLLANENVTFVGTQTKGAILGPQNLFAVCGNSDLLMLRNNGVLVHSATVNSSGQHEGTMDDNAGYSIMEWGKLTLEQVSRNNEIKWTSADFYKRRNETIKNTNKGTVDENRGLRVLSPAEVDEIKSGND